MDIEQVRQLAKDETTLPEKLRELANSTDSITRQNVVMNPNVPADVLIKLAGEFLRQVFDNPAIDLLLLETPNLFSGTSADVLCSLLKREVSTRMIEYAANATDERLKLAVLMNPQTPQEVVEQLANSRNIEIAEAAKLHINYPQDINNNDQKFIEEEINEILESADKHMEWEIAFNKVRNYPAFFEGSGMAYDAFTKKISDALSKNNSSKKSLELPLLSDEEIESLFSLISRNYILKNPEYIRKIAANQNTPIAILEKIADCDESGKTHSQLADNCKISVYIIKKMLEKLSINSSKTNRYAWHNGNDRRMYHQIISNPATPIEILEALANHPNNEIKAIAANSPEMPKHLVKKILSDFENENCDFTSIKYEYNYLIKNSLLSGKLIDRLISFSELKKKLTKKHNSLRHGKPLWINELVILAKHHNINSTTLKTLLEHEEKSIRNSAFSNIKIPQYIADEWGLSFLETLNISQLQTIASNLYTPDIIFEKLVKHDRKYWYVVNDTLNNPCIPNRIVNMWENSPFYNSLMLKGVRNKQERFLGLWKSLLSDCNRLTILFDTRTPIPLLTKISYSTSWLERYAIAKNPNTPLPIIQRLTKDGNRIVRATAKAQLKTKQ